MKTSFEHVVKWIKTLIFFIVSVNGYSQAVVTTSGDWDNTGIWSGGNVGDNLETVTFNNSIGPVVVPASTTYTISGLDMGNSNTLSVDGFLSIGDALNSADLTADNGCTITIGSSGEVVIWGSLIALNNLSFGLGKLTIKGNLDIRNGADINIVGTVQIDGDFIADNNTTVNIGSSGNLNVDGEYVVGNGSIMTGTGTATGDPCTGPDDFCIFSPLPVKLVEFNGVRDNNVIELIWVTASELNNDYFDIEKSDDGVNFLAIGRVDGNGTTDNRHIYHFTDYSVSEKPTYYRLNQVDFDGSNEYSKLIVVNPFLSKAENVSVYPNPGERSKDSYMSSVSSIKSVTVLDVNGRQILNLKPDAGSDKQLKLPRFTNSGIFILKYELVNGTSGQLKFSND